MQANFIKFWGVPIKIHFSKLGSFTVHKKQTKSTFASEKPNNLNKAKPRVT